MTTFFPALAHTDMMGYLDDKINEVVFRENGLVI